MGKTMNGSTDFTTDFAEESKKFFEKMFGMSADKIPSRVHVMHLKSRDIWIDFEHVATLELDHSKVGENAIIINGGKPIAPVFQEDVGAFKKLVAAYERYMSLKTMPFNVPNSGER